MQNLTIGGGTLIDKLEKSSTSKKIKLFGSLNSSRGDKSTPKNAKKGASIQVVVGSVPPYMFWTMGNH